MYLFEIVLAVMLSTLSPPHIQTSYPRPQQSPCPLSQVTTIGEGLPPSIMGLRGRPLHCRAARRTLVINQILRSHRYPLHAPPSPPTHTTPLHATTLCHTLTPSTRHVRELDKIVFRNIPPREASARTKRCAALQSVNPQPWRFTNDSLGLPHAHSFFVCRFL